MMPETTTTENNNHDLIIDFWVLVMLTGMLCSKAALAIGMAGFSLTALYFHFRYPSKSETPLLPFLLPIPIFLITAFSGLQSEDIGVWMDYIAKKSPFLVLPLAFYALRDHMREKHLTHLAIFVIMISLASLGILANYLMNFESINVDISQGKALNTPIDHTEYSIFVAFAAITSLFLYLEPQRRILKMGSKSTFLLFFIFLTLFIHILAVRSGLAVYYLTMGLLMGLHLLRQKKYKLLIGMMVGLLLLPLIAVNTVPSLKKKLGYARWDLKQYKAGKGLAYSDSERIYSLKAGWELFQDQPVLGTGIGDLKHRCLDIYRRDLGKAIDHYPHNQYLFALAGMGILGFLVYGFSILGPLFLFRNNYHPYFLGLMLVVLISGMAENTLERTYSIGFYLFFALSSYCHLTRIWAQRK